MKVNLQNVAIVLFKPHFPENIGSSARAAKNMGIKRLIVVDPVECDLTRILRMATHTAEDIIAEMEVHENIDDALSPFQYIVGTTARTGSHRRTIANPRFMAEQLAPISQNNQVALLFGPEDRGLSNQELKYCHTVVTIPTAEFASLNLSQAVMVMAYELFLLNINRSTPFTPRLANSRELEEMYKHLGEILIKVSFINPENPEYWMQSVRRFFSRIQLRAREVRMIRGICRQINWYCNQRVRELAKTDMAER